MKALSVAEQLSAGRACMFTLYSGRKNNAVNLGAIILQSQLIFYHASWHVDSIEH